MIRNNHYTLQVTRETISQMSSQTAGEAPSPVAPPAYQWVEVGVLGYSTKTKRYLVQRSNMGLNWRHPQCDDLADAVDATAANTGDCKDGSRVSVISIF